ncbi:MAG: histidinol phosphatase [Blastocatellia bacterium]
MTRTHLFLLWLCLAAGVVPPLRGAQAQTSAARDRLYSFTERMQPERLRAVRADRERHARARRAVRLRMGLDDYRAILHAHAEDAKHTGGTRPEMLRAAKQAGVRIIMLTDHVRPPRDFINDSWRGVREGVLFIPGAEAEGFLVYPKRSIMNRKWQTREEYIGLARENGGDIFLSHVEERPDWATAPLTGMEIYNHHTDAKDEQMEFIKWLTATTADPDVLAAFQKLLPEYPQEIMASQQDYLTAIIAKWDRDSATHRVTGVAANDCHHNQVVTAKVGADGSMELWLTGDDKPSLTIREKNAPRLKEVINGRAPGAVIATLDFDPYERSMQYVSTHVLTNTLTEPGVRAALKQAHAYVAHDWLCDPTGFAVTAQAGKRRVGVMGDEVRMKAGLRIRAATPAPAVIRLYHNGVKIQEVEAAELDEPLNAPGVWRVEAWLRAGGELRPWIYANPIRCLAAP